MKWCENSRPHISQMSLDSLESRMSSLLHDQGHKRSKLLAVTVERVERWTVRGSSGGLGGELHSEFQSLDARVITRWVWSTTSDETSSRRARRVPRISSTRHFSVPAPSAFSTITSTPNSSRRLLHCIRVLAAVSSEPRVKV